MYLVLTGARDRIWTDGLFLTEEMLYQLSYTGRMFMVEERGFEPLKAEPADLQSAPFDHSGTPPLWSRRSDLNGRPADYKSAALPTELRQPATYF